MVLLVMPDTKGHRFESFGQLYLILEKYRQRTFLIGTSLRSYSDSELRIVLKNPLKDLNDDLLPTLMGRLMAETRVSHDRPVTANMASREHYL